MRLFKQISLDGEDDFDLILRNENESTESSEIALMIFQLLWM